MSQNKLFEIGKWGGILDVEYADWFLLINDDTNGSTGGFYIYIVKDPKDKNNIGHDDWVEDVKDLNRYMNDVKYHINWNL